MKLELGAPLSYDPQNMQLTVKRLFDAYFELIEKLEHMTRYLDDENILELTADKIAAGTITAKIEIKSPVITGGTLRTSKEGKRVEVSENQIKCYNKDNQLNGFCIDNSDAQYGDVSFYSNGVKMLTIYNTLADGFTLWPASGKTLTIGATDATVIFSGKTNFDSLALTEQMAPDPEEGKIKLYFDGSNLKAVLPNGNIKTVVLS